MLFRVFVIFLFLSSPLAAQPVAVRLQQADEASRSGDLVAAERLYSQVAEGLVGQTPSTLHARVWSRLSDVHDRLARFDKAVEWGRQYLSLAPELHEPGTTRQVLLRVGRGYFELGHRRAAVGWLEKANQAGTAEALGPFERFAALEMLARAHESLGDEEAAARSWSTAEDEARRLLTRHRGVLTEPQRLACSIELARCAKAQGRLAEATLWLADVVAREGQRGNLAGQSEAYAELASLHKAMGNPAETRRCLEQAVAIEERARPQSVRHADLLVELALALRTAAEHGRADELFRKAESIYQRTLAEAREPGSGSLRALDVFWKLEDLYRQTSNHKAALELVSQHGPQWEDEGLLSSELSSELGAIQTMMGSFQHGRDLLSRCLAFRRSQDPPDLVALPRTLNNLALIEHALGRLAESQELAQETIDLYAKHARAEDDVLASAHGLLAASATIEGRLADAIERYRQAVAICERVGAAADGQRARLLLGLSVAYRSQGMFAEAKEACLAALAIHERTEGPDSLGGAAFHCALGSLHQSCREFPQARESAQQALAICERRGLSGGSLVLAARHVLAVSSLFLGQRDLAEKLLEQIVEEEQEAGRAVMVGRTLNYLAATAEAKGDRERAESLYRQALGTGADDGHPLPVTRFITLWRLAGLVFERGERDEARDLLDRALGIAEEVRAEVFGGTGERAAFFDQFAPAFDALVHWHLADGRIDQALFVAERARSRTLLDQLRMASVDPRAGLGKADLLVREGALRQQIAAVRAQARYATLGATDERAAELGEELLELQRQYSRLWTEILAASPAYQSAVGARVRPEAISAVVQRLVDGGAMLLFYYLGQHHSYLVLYGKAGPEVFPLQVPAGVVEVIAKTGPAERKEGLGEPSGQTGPGGPGSQERGMRLRYFLPPVPVISKEKPVPLGWPAAGYLVECYLRAIASPGFGGSGTQRGLELDSGAQTWRLSAAQALTDILLPVAARARIRDAKPSHLVVMPHGPLRKLPFEALMTEEGPRPRFLVDELPPIVYAPSANVLAAIEGRGPKAARPWSILAVGNPAYPQSRSVASRAAPTRAGGRDSLVRLGVDLPALPGTLEECRAVERHFGAGQVKLLVGAAATEGNVTAELAGRRIVHLAAHGFVDEQYGNLFGALALSPPASEVSGGAEDGFLSLHEIHSLPLAGCELAVLSACQTNVGVERKLEAGATLAQAFMAAGAERVVASHWTVYDPATAALMGHFFEELARSADTGPDYAAALQTARKRVREHPQWSAPYFWAPFVLIGSR